MILLIPLLIVLAVAAIPLCVNAQNHFLGVKNTLWLLRATCQQMRLGSPDEAEFLDRGSLGALSSEFEALGFESIGQCLWQQKAQTGEQQPPIADPVGAPQREPNRFEVQDFVRVFVHRAHSCWGTITVSTVRDSHEKLSTKTNTVIAVNSSTGNTKQNWFYQTNNARWNPTQIVLMKLWRQPRVLATVFADASAEQLLAEHLMRREQIAWQREITRNECFAICERAATRMRATLVQLTPLAMAWRLFWLEREKDGPTPEWLGELQGRIAPL